MRFKHNRETFIPADAIRVTPKNADVLFCLYGTDDRPCAMAFVGKAQKPTWQYYFKNNEQREKRIKATIEACEAKQQFKDKLKKDRQEAPRGLEIGDILRASWGYDQTNIDYYEVTGLTGKRMVWLRKIGAVSIDTNWAQGECAPEPGLYISKPFKRQACNGAVKIDSCSRAYKMEPESNIGGIKTYASSSWSSYA